MLWSCVLCLTWFCYLCRVQSTFYLCSIVVVVVSFLESVIVRHFGWNNKCLTAFALSGLQFPFVLCVSDAMADPHPPLNSATKWVQYSKRSMWGQQLISPSQLSDWAEAQYPFCEFGWHLTWNPWYVPNFKHMFCSGKAGFEGGNIRGRHGALWILLTIFIKESSHVQRIHIQL